MIKRDSEIQEPDLSTYLDGLRPRARDFWEQVFGKLQSIGGKTASKSLRAEKERLLLNTQI